MILPHQPITLRGLLIRRSVDLTFTANGHFNAVVFWFHLELYGGITLSTAPEAVAAGKAHRSFHPSHHFRRRQDVSGRCNPRKVVEISMLNVKSLLDSDQSSARSSLFAC